MSGYKRPKKIYRLVFADPEMEGLEVRARSTSMGDYQLIMRLMMKLRQNPEVVEEDLDTIDDMLGQFAKVLVSWNLEVDTEVNGRTVTQPVPATKDGLLDQDIDFVMAIIDAWTDAVGGVDPELGKDSTSGGSFPEVTIPMELLSTSPGN